MQEINTPPKKPTKTPVLLQVVPSLDSGGVERGTCEIAKAAVKKGFRSLVISSGGKMVKTIEDSGTEHILYPLDTKNPLAIRKNAKGLHDIIKDYGVDIVHARSRAPAWSAYKAAKKAECHFITTFHGFHSGNSILKRKYNSIMAKGEKVIAVSNFMKDYIIKNFGLPEEMIEVIHRGVDLDYFNPDIIPDTRLQPLREAWRIEKDYPIIFMPGRITRWKGQDFLLNALSRLDNTPYYCVIAGSSGKNSDYRRELMDMVIKSQLEKKVRIVDDIVDIPAAYKLADVVVSASTRGEAFGRIAVEAQAMGCPVVATDLGGSKETIIHGETGRLVSTFTSGEMAEGLQKGIELDQFARKDLALVTRKHIEDNFSLDLMCNKTFDLYRRILETRSMVI